MAHYETEKTFKGWQKILPNQEFNSNLYRRTDRPIEASIYDTILDVCGIRPPQEEFEIEQTEMFTIEEMASSPITLSLLQWLIRSCGIRSVLEIGAFVGVSAMYFARALPEDGKVVTIEKFSHFAEIARRNFERNGLSDKIQLICADAAEALAEATSGRAFDLVFIDGNKERYADYMDAVMDAVNPGGIMVVDDALFHGDVFNEVFESEKGRGVRAALERAKNLSGWEKTFLPISNGMMLLRKTR